MADSTRVDETPDERKVSEETGATPDESHRIGEFDELRNLIESVRDEISGLRSALADMMASKPADDAVQDDDETNESELINIDELDL